LALHVRADGSQRFDLVFRFDPAQNKFVPAEIDLGNETDQVFLVLFATGLRDVAPSAIRAEIGGRIADVLFVGEAPGFSGVDQVNIRLSRALIGRGDVSGALMAYDHAANPVMISIK
jgi:uncharacterized protein (TIGR03437 family)